MTIFLVFAIFLSITSHEWAHGFAADKLGDPTPKSCGRLTFNPVVHIDIFGTLILPVLLCIMSLTFWGYPLVLGYAKPIEINPNHFKQPKRDILWVGLSGPLMNLAIALVLTLFLKVFKVGSQADLFLGIILVNLILFVFNLLPIPPLDGAKVLASLLPYRFHYKYLRLAKFGFPVIVVLFLMGFMHWFIFPVVNAILQVLGVYLRV
ncbi:MAG: site-2 protease family protein [Candidatus Omnitrophica bacterium]|nr:site-2 protease family protein [Candidatus Omnitrophota bacterium]